MPVSTRRSPVTIAEYQVDDALLTHFSQRSREDGKRMSHHALLSKAAGFGASGRDISAEALERAYDSFEVTHLPPQIGQRPKPSVRAAIVRFYLSMKDTLQEQPAEVIPEDFARIMIDSMGVDSSPEQTFVSAYIPNREGRGIKRLVTKNEIYFEFKKFGTPDRVFGPFVIDARGISINETPPPAQDDGFDETALLSTLPSQVDLRQQLEDGSLMSQDGFAWDATGNEDVTQYMLIAQRQIARLSNAQNQELETVAGYKQHGSQTPEVNHWLRDKPRARHVSVSLLDAVFERGTLLPEGMLLFRGLAADQLIGLRGKTLTDPAFLSTSLDPGMARSFADEAARNGGQKILMAIEIGRGVTGVVSGNKGETEVILPRGQKLRIVSKRHDAGYDIYHLRAG